MRRTLLWLILVDISGARHALGLPSLNSIASTIAHRANNCRPQSPRRLLPCGRPLSRMASAR